MPERRGPGNSSIRYQERLVNQRPDASQRDADHHPQSQRSLEKNLQRRLRVGALSDLTQSSQHIRYAHDGINDQFAQSPSRFRHEYRRMSGAPPRQDVEAVLSADVLHRNNVPALSKESVARNRDRKKFVTNDFLHTTCAGDETTDT